MLTWLISPPFPPFFAFPLNNITETPFHAILAAFLSRPVYSTHPPWILAPNCSSSLASDGRTDGQAKEEGRWCVVNFDYQAIKSKAVGRARAGMTPNPFSLCDVPTTPQRAKTRSAEKERSLGQEWSLFRASEWVCGTGARPHGPGIECRTFFTGFGLDNGEKNGQFVFQSERERERLREREN